MTPIFYPADGEYVAMIPMQNLAEFLKKVSYERNLLRNPVISFPNFARVRT